MHIAGFEKSTVSKAMKDVTDALASRTSTYLQWPVTADAKDSIKACFYLQARFQNVVGCTDGTHIRIHVIAPTSDENAYINRRGFHSINVQAVCDHDGK